MLSSVLFLKNLPIQPSNQRFARLLARSIIFLAGLFLLANPAKAEFDGFGGLRYDLTASEYIKNWGPPDLFMVSLKPPSPNGKNPQRYDLWVYLKHGTQLVFQDGKVSRQYFFSPTEAKKYSRAAKINPLDFSFANTTSHVSKKLGAPDQFSRSLVAGQKLTKWLYKKNGTKIDCVFHKGTLSFVSAGIESDTQNPWLNYQPRPANPKDLQQLFGTWSSNYGTVVLKPSSRDPRFFEGVLQTRPLHGEPMKGLGIISQGSFDKDNNFIRFNFQMDYHNIDGHAEFFLSDDKKRLNGSLIIRRNCWGWWMER